ncbi:MAG TPA: 1-deoxy-D-xylulose-5-phosphate synthase [Ignavibacteriales bacterium]|nr:1-deoxy-D-xylulose-5-phosphate synthase [Ignavibacteriales bacterium]
MINVEKYPLLSKVDYPKDLKNFSITELNQLANEVRCYLLEVISEVGGHLGSGLGAVELTIALHRVFDTPKDKIILDTGHQGYPHKILTGRKELLPTIRQLGGLSGFLKREESEYDEFGAGHASTSISAALGIAKAFEYLKCDNKVIAVIGDGAMTGGMVYEAMNNAASYKTNLIVVFNDNNMSIDNNVWYVQNFFTDLISNPEYNKIKDQVWEVAGKFDSIGDRFRKLVGKIHSGVKSIVTPGMMFEALGFRYFGPVNGHSIPKLVKIFEAVKNLHGPILVHVATQKGYGYKPAENDKQKLHASTPFDIETGKALKKSTIPTFTKIFGQTLVKIAKDNSKVIGITAAMPDGTGLDLLKDAIPERYIDVGIAEEHAVTFAAGMATQGMIPVVAIYSTFLQRAFDQIVHDVALQKLHVVFALDRAGLVGADGPTHHGSLDLSYLRIIPNMVVMAPKDEAELRDMLNFAVNKYNDGPIALRYPRGNAMGVELKEEFKDIELGKAEIIQEGNDVCILAVGNFVYYAIETAKILQQENISVQIYNMRFIKPLDTDVLELVVKKFNKIVTYAENTIVGGFGSAVAEFLVDNQYKNDILRIELPDKFIEHGTQQQLHELVKVDAKSVAEKIKNFLKK